MRRLHHIGNIMWKQTNDITMCVNNMRNYVVNGD